MIDLTPLEVRKKKGDFRRTMRGYEPALVDDFLDLVADRLDELVRENMALAERAAEQDQQVAEYRERERALTEALVTAQQVREEIRQQTTREAEQVRRVAEQDAEQVRSRAETHAAELRAAAEQEAAQLRAAAEEDAVRIRRTAEREAGELRASAGEEATRIREAAEQEAAELRSTGAAAAEEASSPEAHRAAGPLTEERAREEAALQRLRARHEQFLGSYRAFLEKELSALEGAAAIAAGLGAPARGRAGAEPAAQEPREPESILPGTAPDAGLAPSEAGPGAAEQAADPVAAEPQPQGEAEVEPQPGPEPQSQPELQPGPHLEPQPDPESQSQPELQPDPEPQPQPESQPPLDTLSFDLEPSWPAIEVEALGGSADGADEAAATPAGATASEAERAGPEPGDGASPRELDGAALPELDDVALPESEDDLLLPGSEGDLLADLGDDLLAELEDDLVLPELDVEPLEPFAPEPYEPGEAVPPVRADRSGSQGPAEEQRAADEGVQPDDAIHAFEASLPEVAPAAFERDPIAEAVEEEIAGLTDDVGSAVSPWGLFEEPPADRQTGPDLYDGVSPDETDDGVPGPIGLTPLETETADWRSAPELSLGFRVVDTEGAAAPMRARSADATPASSAAPDANVPLPDASGVAAEETDVETVAQADAEMAAETDEETDADAETDALLRNAAAAGYQVPDDDELLLEDVLEDDADDDDGWLPGLLEDDR